MLLAFWKRKQRRTMPRTESRPLPPIRRQLTGTAPRRAAVMHNYYESKPRGLSITYVRWIVGVIAGVLIIQSLLRVPFLKVRNVDISGLKYVPIDQILITVKEQLDRPRWFIFTNDNYFLVKERWIQHALEEKYYVTVVRAKTSFPKTLHLELQERISGFVQQTPEKYYQLDTRGQRIGEIEAPEMGQTILADERSNTESTLPLDYLEQATHIKNQWESAITNVKIVKFHLKDTNEHFIITTDKGYRVLLSREHDIDKQIGRLAIYVTATDVQPAHEYVDLRFEETLYIK